MLYMIPDIFSHGDTMTSSGVLYVHKIRNQRLKKGFSWAYSHNSKYYYATSLLRLEKRIRALKLPWIVTDDEVYEEVLSQEWEDDDINVLAMYN